MLNEAQQKQQAKRALQEAKLRKLQEQNKNNIVEIGGRGGKDPVRYGDWEIKGRAIDF